MTRITRIRREPIRVDILQILFTTRRFSKIKPLRRSIGYRQMRYREGAKARSCAKNYQSDFAKLRFFAVIFLSCDHTALDAFV